MYVFFDATILVNKDVYIIIIYRIMKLTSDYEHFRYHRGQAGRRRAAGHGDDGVWRRTVVAFRAEQERTSPSASAQRLAEHLFRGTLGHERHRRCFAVERLERPVDDTRHCVLMSINPTQ